MKFANKKLKHHQRRRKKQNEPVMINTSAFVIKTVFKKQNTKLSVA